jgi:hypothetical protein
MQDWQDRVVEEKAELDGRIERLQGFMKGREEFWDLDEDARYDMRQQLDAMKNYSHALGRRISRFPMSEQDVAEEVEQAYADTGSLDRAWDEPEGLSYELSLTGTPQEPAEKRPPGETERQIRAEAKDHNDARNKARMFEAALKGDFTAFPLHCRQLLGTRRGASPDDLVRAALRAFVFSQGRLPRPDDVLAAGPAVLADLLGTPALAVEDMGLAERDCRMPVAKLFGVLPVSLATALFTGDHLGLELLVDKGERHWAFVARQTFAEKLEAAQ